jgi:hypothetical protein
MVDDVEVVRRPDLARGEKRNGRTFLRSEKFMVN